MRIPLIIAIGCISVLASTSTAALAQSAKKASQYQLTKEFRTGFMKGCLAGKTPKVKNQTGFCNCYANAFQKRFDGFTLNAITQTTGSIGEKGPVLVGLMMSPEAKACVAKF